MSMGNRILKIYPLAFWGLILYNGSKLCKNKENNMKKYVCKVCGEVYDPANNDNIPFEALPDDWACPVCGVGKDQFEEM